LLLHHNPTNQEIINDNLKVFEENDDYIEMRLKFEEDFYDIDDNKDGYITIGELGTYKKNIGHYDPKREEEFDMDNECMVMKMNDPLIVGGNNDTLIDKDEFLSYLAL